MIVNTQSKTYKCPHCGGKWGKATGLCGLCGKPMNPFEPVTGEERPSVGAIVGKVLLAMVISVGVILALFVAFFITCLVSVGGMPKNFH